MFSEMHCLPESVMLPLLGKTIVTPASESASDEDAFIKEPSGMHSTYINILKGDGSMFLQKASTHPQDCNINLYHF
jgi:hypothetical protein